MKTPTRMIGLWINPDVVTNLKSLAHKRELTLSDLVRGMAARELANAVQTGEWKPRETPKVEVASI